MVEIIIKKNVEWIFEPATLGWEKKEFLFWIQETQAWKCATESLNGLKNVHSLQLALHLRDGSEIKRQIFDTLDTEDLKSEAGWKAPLRLKPA